MTMTPDAPADTTMMRIVHDAIRRDLARAQAALADPGLSAKRRAAIGAHLGWMMRFLRSHHAAEDEGLYPVARARATEPADRDVLDRMGRGHEDVAVAVTALDAAATALATDATEGAASRTLAALDDLAAVLLPHLRDEEDEAMPLVSQLLTAREWQAIDKAHNLDPKSNAQLGFEGHWIIDGATEADRAIVLALVPPLPRFLLLHGYARRYRRHLAACWGDDARAPRRVQRENRVTVTVDARIQDVWDVVRDVTRVGEWSHECIGAQWLGDARAAVPGAQFRGRNRAGVFRWGRRCEVIAAEPYELGWRTVPTALYPDSSEWRITLTAAQGGTMITQEFQVVRVPPVLGTLYALLIPTHRDRTAALTADLIRLGAVAAGTSGASPTPTALGG
jgi:hypothetical protein